MTVGEQLLEKRAVGFAKRHGIKLHPVEVETARRQVSDYVQSSADYKLQKNWKSVVSRALN